MATMNISMPDQMRDWVEDQTRTGLYANNSDYIRDLIRKDQIRQGKLHALQHGITAGIESGRSAPLDIASIKQKARLEAEQPDK